MFLCVGGDDEGDAGPADQAGKGGHDHEEGEKVEVSADLRIISTKMFRQLCYL